MIFALSNVPWTSIIRDVFVSVWNRNGFAILKGRCAIWGTIIQRASLFELRAGLANYVWCNLSLLWTVLSFWDLYSLFKRKRLGKKSRFFLELNEMPNKNGRFATGFVRHFSILMHGRRLWPNAVLLNQFSKALSQIYRQTVLGYFHHGKRLSCIWKKPDQSCNCLQLIRLFNLRHRFFSASVVC